MTDDAMNDAMALANRPRYKNLDIARALRSAVAAVRQLRQVCAEAYQIAGACAAPQRALDQLSAAAQGEPLPHASVLPLTDDELKHDPGLGDRMDMLAHPEFRMQSEFGQEYSAMLEYLRALPEFNSRGQCYLRCGSHEPRTHTAACLRVAHAGIYTRE